VLDETLLDYSLLRVDVPKSALRQKFPYERTRKKFAGIQSLVYLRLLW
jgi:hypothetical protein